METQVETPMPFLERHFGEARMIEDIEELAQMEDISFELVECAYHMGYLEEAAIAADSFVKDDLTPESMVALCLKMCAHVAMADVPAACASIRRLEAACRSAGQRMDDPVLYGVSVVCARIVEDCMLVPFLWVPDRLPALCDAPQGLQSYIGYQIATRALWGGEAQQAIGMARSFLVIAGDRYPVSCVKLYLVIASASLRLGDTTRAVEAFKKAWDLASPLGIIMPFAELGAFIPGLIRHCLQDSDKQSYLMLRSLIQRYRVGWHGLRARMGFPVVGSDLTILEYSTVTLALWGWTNREVAQFLGVSENTVKHYLTSTYQKLDVKNRSELMDTYQGGMLVFEEPVQFDKHRSWLE